ncbi:het-domain-containing protein [Botryosphaeria dothidea]|uniref:Het-domain-containing protein n=1 Tax=Botryosphaeria dothidea TaxID=55169 RepID=A0A8H4ING2_9PEZI|nr:het-domain-containing protein [Botryosphaeria dothidea]
MPDSKSAESVDRLYNSTQLGENHIRLLKLHPGFQSDPLFGNLLRRSITKNHEYAEANAKDKDTSDGPSAEKYWALSYTWGPAATQGNEKYIKIIAEDESYSISIKPNLHAALVRLRRPEHHIFLWIDALCINQSDNKEKSAQIPRMPHIYHGAENVCIWLGLEEEDSAKAMTFIQECFEIDDFDGLFHNDHSEQWYAVSKLMRRPWFSRRWIVQELARARKAEIYCGDHVPINWENFADIISLMSSRQKDLTQLFRESKAFRNHPDFIGDLGELAAVKLIRVVDNAFRKNSDGQIVGNSGLLSLEALMSSLSAFEASDPRDILYAILWLANDAEPATKNNVRKWNLWKDALNGRGIMPIKTDQLTRFFERASYGFVQTQTPMGSNNPSPTASRQGSLVKQHTFLVRSGSDPTQILDGLQVTSPPAIEAENPFGAQRPLSEEQEVRNRGVDEAYEPLSSFANGAQVTGNENPSKPNGNAIQGTNHVLQSNSNILEAGNCTTGNDTKEVSSIETKKLSISEPRPLSEKRQSLQAVADADPQTLKANPLRLSFGPSAASYTSDQNPDIYVSIPSENEEERTKRTAKFFMSNLASQRFERLIVVDYEKTFFEVCKDFLAFSYKRSKSLDMMLYPWAPTHLAHEAGGHNRAPGKEEGTEKKRETAKDEPLPSWIPTLWHKPFSLDYAGAHRRINADPLVGTPGHGHKSYNASKAKWSLLRWDDIDAKAVYVRGFILDRVTWKGSPAMEGIIPSDWVEAGGWKDADQLPPDEFWRSLVGGLDAYGQRPPYHWKRTCRDAFRRRQSYGDLDTKQIITHGCPSHIEEFLKRVQCVVWKRRLFGMKRLSDALGIGSRHVKKGDFICIIYGCSVPVILRRYEGDKPTSKGKHTPKPNDDEENVTYRLIGECYVYGMMNGEALTPKDNWDYQNWVREFKLK